MLTPPTSRFSKAPHDLCDNYLDARRNSASEEGFVGVVQNFQSSKGVT